MSSSAAADEWHVSPAVDAIGYHFHWLCLLIPLLFLGNQFRKDYLFLVVLVQAGNVTHQFLTCLLMLFDRELLRRHRTQFLAASLLTLAGAAGTLALCRADVALFWRLMLPVSTGAGLWNLWHIYMQKYGLFRLYGAKSAAPPERTPPTWSDRLLVLSWVPLYFAVLGPRHRDLILAWQPMSRGVLEPAIAGLAAVSSWLVPAAAVFAAASAALFLRNEWRAYGLRNAPRLSMALGMTGLSASFLLVNPVKAVVCFGFGHEVEYFLFVWAYERRRAGRAAPDAAAVPAGRFLAVLLAAVGALFFALIAWGEYGRRYPSVAGVPLGRVGIVLILYQALLHFYRDGVLWKIRRPEVLRRL